MFPDQISLICPHRESGIFSMSQEPQLVSCLGKRSLVACLTQEGISFPPAEHGRGQGLTMS